jgi:3-hydroxyacyl-CoA dehydrogenase
MVKVAKGVYDNCPTDEARNAFVVPAWLQKMVDNNWLGDKSGQGFFKKVMKGKESEILTLNLQTMEYGPRNKPKFASVEAAKQLEDLKQRIKALCQGGDKAGDFYRHFHYGLFSYISHRYPEISDELYRVDDAMMAGFGWEIGAYESWDVLGVPKTAEAMKKAGYTVAPWVDEMIAKGKTSFYKVENGVRVCYSPSTGTYVSTVAKGQESAFIVMKNVAGQSVWKNSACNTYHLGDDVLGLEWNTKMGSIGGEVLEGIQKSIALAEEKYKGLVIANDTQNFSAGANVGMIFMLAIEQEFDELDMAIRMFQNTMTRARFSSVPVVVAPHALARRVLLLAHRLAALRLEPLLQLGNVELPVDFRARRAAAREAAAAAAPAAGGDGVRQAGVLYEAAGRGKLARVVVQLPLRLQVVVQQREGHPPAFARLAPRGGRERGEERLRGRAVRAERRKGLRVVAPAAHAVVQPRHAPRGLRGEGGARAASGGGRQHAHRHRAPAHRGGQLR